MITAGELKSIIYPSLVEYELYVDDKGYIWDDEGHNGGYVGREYAGETFNSHNAPRVLRGGDDDWSRKPRRPTDPQKQAKLQALSKAKPDKFITSVYSQLSRKGSLSPKQMSVVVRILEKQGLYDEAQVFGGKGKPLPKKTNPSPQTAGAVAKAKVSTDNREAKLKVLDDVLGRGSNNFLVAMKKLVMANRALTVNQAKAIRHQLHRMKMHDAAKLFKEGMETTASELRSIIRSPVESPIEESSAAMAMAMGMFNKQQAQADAEVGKEMTKLAKRYVGVLQAITGIKNGWTAAPTKHLLSIDNEDAGVTIDIHWETDMGTGKVDLTVELNRRKGPEGPKAKWRSKFHKVQGITPAPMNLSPAAVLGDSAVRRFLKENAEKLLAPLLEDDGWSDREQSPLLGRERHTNKHKEEVDMDIAVLRNIVEGHNVLAEVKMDPFATKVRKEFMGLVRSLPKMLQKASEGGIPWKPKDKVEDGYRDKDGLLLGMRFVHDVRAAKAKGVVSNPKGNPYVSVSQWKAGDNEFHVQVGLDFEEGGDTDFIDENVPADKAVGLLKMAPRKFAAWLAKQNFNYTMPESQEGEAIGGRLVQELRSLIEYKGTPYGKQDASKEADMWGSKHGEKKHVGSKRRSGHSVTAKKAAHKGERQAAKKEIKARMKGESLSLDDLGETMEQLGEAGMMANPMVRQMDTLRTVQDMAEQLGRFSTEFSQYLKKAMKKEQVDVGRLGKFGRRVDAAHSIFRRSYESLLREELEDGEEALEA